MKTKKRTLSKIISATMALSLSFALGFTALGATLGYSSSWGYYTAEPVTVSLSALDKDTPIISLPKCIPDKKYGCFQLNQGGTVNSMNVWIENIDGKRISEKYRFEPGAHYQFIFYYKDTVIEKNGLVCFVGEQSNITTKKAVYEAWGY
ncbi:MAG: hypothetical protein K1V95_02780 [Eubacterium sp.]